MPISDVYASLKTKFKRVFTTVDDFTDKPPKKGEPLVGEYVDALWEDGMKSFENSFASTKETTRFGFNSPEDFYRACSKLESGQHFEVYPSRTAAGTDNTDNSWKQELIDNEIQKQIRAKKNHITANWHDIVITPNISGINEVFDQERKATGWSERVREWVGFAQVYGEVDVRSILDKSENAQGVATEMTCEPGSLMRTPESKSIKKIDGCWYIIHGQRVTDAWVRKNYPDFEIPSTGDKKTPKFLQIDKDFKNNNYTHTKMLNKLELFLDDESFEEIPFDQGEFDQRIGSMMANLQAGEMNQVVPKEEDNHKKYIRAYLDWLKEKTDFYQKYADDTFNQGGNLAPEETQLMHQVVNSVDEQVNMHEAMRSKGLEKTGEEKVPDGKRVKYPFGRYVVTLEGNVVEDIPNPYNNDWRRLFHTLKNENVPWRRDGRGDVEILWQDNKILDTMLSRFADDALLATYKKPWLNIAEKGNIDKDGYSTSPLVPGYYSQAPPQFVTGTANNQYLESYKLAKNGIKESLSVNQVTRGESSFSGESGAHAEALLNQNVVQVAGELNQNLNDFLEDIVESRIMLWKEFYTEPRAYIIDGHPQELVLAEVLRQTVVEENGQLVAKDIGAIEVAVKPDSNFPNRLEGEINMLVKLAGVMNEDGLPLIPSDAILDLISEKFPSLSVGGKYRKEVKLLALGKQTMMQQQQQAEKQKEEAKTDPINAIKKKVQNQLTSAAADQITGRNNGNGKE